MRGLKERFVGELQSGKLAWFLQEIKQNPGLFLSIEKNGVDIYYKGTAMLTIRAGGGYAFGLQERFFTSDAMKEELAIFQRDKKAVPVYQRKFPVLVQAMDESSEETEVQRQLIASANPFILAMDYQVAEDITIDMIGIYQGKVVALQHNLGQSIGRVAPVYEALEKLWASPEGKDTLIGSLNAISANLAALGLRDEAVTVTDPSLHFVALLSDSDGEIPANSLPLTVLPVADTATTIELGDI
ncbi:MAG: hypothetical protein R3Y63_11895 [Eubacteriales bacterium]